MPARFRPVRIVWICCLFLLHGLVVLGQDADAPEPGDVLQVPIPVPEISELPTHPAPQPIAPSALQSIRPSPISAPAPAPRLDRPADLAEYMASLDPASRASDAVGALQLLRLLPDKNLVPEEEEARAYLIVAANADHLSGEPTLVADFVRDPTAASSSRVALIDWSRHQMKSDLQSVCREVAARGVSEDELVRVFAVRLLGNAGLQEGDELVGKLLAEESGFVAVEALYALAKVSRSDLVETVSKELDSSDYRRQLAALSLLTRSGTKQTQAAIWNWFKEGQGKEPPPTQFRDPIERLQRKSAFAALRAVDSDAAFDALLGAALSPDEDIQIRMAAVASAMAHSDRFSTEHVTSIIGTDHPNLVIMLARECGQRDLREYSLILRNRLGVATDEYEREVLTTTLKILEGASHE